MVALDASAQESACASECVSTPSFQVLRPRPVSWYPHMSANPLFNKMPGGVDLTQNSAFQTMGSDNRVMKWAPDDNPDDVTQVTWSSALNYRCSVSVSNSGGGWRYNSSENFWRPAFEDISNESKTAKDEDEDEEIDVVSTDVTTHRVSDEPEVLVTSSPDQHCEPKCNSREVTCGPITDTSHTWKEAYSTHIKQGNGFHHPILRPSVLAKDVQVKTLSSQSKLPSEQDKNTSEAKMDSDSMTMDYQTSPPEMSRHPDLKSNTHSEQSLLRDSIINMYPREHMNVDSMRPIEESIISNDKLYNGSSAKELLSSSSSSKQDGQVHSPVIVNSSEQKHETRNFIEHMRDSKNIYERFEMFSPDATGSNTMSSTESLCSSKGDVLSRRLTFGSIDFKKPRGSLTSYSTGSSESLCSSRGDAFERRQSFGSIDYSKGSLRSIESCPTDSTESLVSINGDLLQRRLTLCSLDLRKLSHSLANYRTDSSESVCSSNGDILQWRPRLGSADCIKKVNYLQFGNYNRIQNADNYSILKRENLSGMQEERESIISNHDQNEQSDSKSLVSKDNKKDLSRDTGWMNKIPKPSSPEKSLEVDANDNSSNAKHTDHGTEQVKEDEKDKNETPPLKSEQRESVLVEPNNGKMNDMCEKEPTTFTPEDVALRSRVLILLWVLLGEIRLREVGYPVDPVHRILWRAVDVCCSVAGVKSAAAVPLNSDHDCGSDMLCFRDHTHRFLEVCAPTREHWKLFGWASLTVDAVVRKIYDEELIPLLRVQSLPPDIQKAAAYLAQMDRPSVMVHNSSQITNQKQEGIPDKQPTPMVPTKKKRGRPAKITHKVEEGGRIERVMLWRFLLNLLEDPKNSPCIHWVQRDEGIFRILNTDWLARLWGRRHGNPRMTYEKMARAMRTYYRSKVLQPVPRLRNLPRKLVYKFNPAVIHKVAAMKLTCSTFSGRGMNYNK